MAIRIVEYAEELRNALAAFNARLAAAGCDVRFPPPRDAAAPPVFHQGLKEARYLALEEDTCAVSAVRGAYALKFQQFWLQGDVISVADFMLPVSEGIIRPEHSLVAVRSYGTRSGGSPASTDWAWEGPISPWPAS